MNETPGRGPRGSKPGYSVKETRAWRQRCKAHVKSTGEPCKAWAMKGQKVCSKHGGKAPQNKRAGARRMAEYEVTTAAANYIKDIAYKAKTGVTDPLAILSELAAEVLAMKDALAQQVNALQGELSSETVEGVEQTRAVVTLYERALDRSMKAAKTLADFDVDGKRVKIQQQQADLVAGLIVTVLAKANLAPEQAEQVRAGMLAGLEQISEMQTKEIAA